MSKTTYRTPKGVYYIEDTGRPYTEEPGSWSDTHLCGFVVWCDTCPRIDGSLGRGYLVNTPTLEDAEGLILMFNHTRNADKLREWKE